LTSFDRSGRSKTQWHGHAGRPQLPRGVFSIEATTLVPPQDLVVDTSFVVDALISAQPNHVICHRFVERLAAVGATLYFNRLLETELVEVAFRLALKERFGKEWMRRRHDGRSRKRVGRLMGQVQAAWEETLASFSFVRVELHEVTDAMPEMMRRYGLGSHDAIHAATSLYAGVPRIATLDTGFASLPASTLTIYTNPARVSVCRGFRAAKGSH